ncbi:MAG TPA: hypothetical protein VGR27_14980, partial [Longimicrobiaceae bacterium]|nr:hypothetical protein [Longimicrobiaceae bacterium]
MSDEQLIDSIPLLLDANTPLLDDGTRPPGSDRDRRIEARFAARVRLNVPIRHGPKVERLIELVNADDELYALWIAENVTAVERLGMTDHGPVHVKIVMNIAAKLLRLLADHGVQPGVVTDYGMELDDAAVVV